MRTTAISMDQGANQFVHGRVPLRMRQGTFERRKRGVRRLGRLQQASALEMLNHAAEYLVDSRLFGLETEVVKDNQEAVQILMRLSRVVFSEYPGHAGGKGGVTGWLRDLAKTGEKVACG